MSPRCRRLLLAALFLAPGATAAAAGARLELTVEVDPGGVLDGTLLEVPGRTPGEPRLAIGVQNAVQTGMPSYAGLITIFVRAGGPSRWRDLGEPFERGNFVWLTAFDNQLIALDRQEVAPPRKLVGGEPPRWRPLTRPELARLEEHLQRDRSALRRPRLAAGRHWVQVLDPRTLEVCRLGAAPGAACRRHELPPGNDIVYTVATDEHGVVLFANEGWFRLMPDGTLHTLWLQTPGDSSQMYAAVRTRSGTVLGHYPSGNVMSITGSAMQVAVRAAFAGAPYTAPARRADREVQSLAHYGGQLFAGVWPWGEIYRHDAASGWRLARRLFSTPPVTDELAPYARVIAADGHPGMVVRLARRLQSALPEWARTDREPLFESKAEGDPDVWGQRVTQLVPLGPSLYAATGNKSGEHVADWLRYLPSPRLAAEYGRVYELTTPGNLACNLPRVRDRLALRFTVARQRLEVWANGVLLCSLVDESLAAAAAALGAAGTLGEGRYGKLTGGRVLAGRETADGRPARAAPN
ncbi:MAG: hypothetical protein IT529_03105 [Burkholderiales bacterium]|nr:hypothetical protein [Burkholderiales bacterium]